MNPDEKPNMLASTSDLPSDLPPPYTPQPSASTSPPEPNDDRNPATLTSTMGEVKVFTTYHIYLSQNYLRTFTGASARHLNSPSPSYLFDVPSSGPHADHLLMHAGPTPSPTPLSTTTFEKDFARSTTTFSDGRTASISVVPRASTRQETRIFRVDIANVKEDLHRHPAVLFWEMGGKKYAGSKGVGDYELVDGERRAYAVVLTAHHKSVKKLGRLHFLVEPGEGLVEVVLGSLLAVWGKADRDVRSGHVGLRT